MTFSDCVVFFIYVQIFTEPAPSHRNKDDTWRQQSSQTARQTSETPVTTQRDAHGHRFNHGGGGGGEKDVSDNQKHAVVEV